MARASLLRALQRLPGAAIAPEATNALRAALSSNTLASIGKEAGVQGTHQQANGFNTKLAMPFSFASQMHTLTRKEEEATPILAQEAPKAPVALTALPPKPSMARRNMASAAAGGHGLEYGEAHPWHLVPASPWPFMASTSTMMFLMGSVGWSHHIVGMTTVMNAGLACILATATAWWRDCLIEGELGMHTELQKKNLVNGVWWFILNEATLFFGLLWACVHLGMSPNVWVQMQWPPVGIDAIGWEGRALVMSAVLAASYYSANVALVAKDPKVVMGALGTTVGLGCLFLADQYLEYTTAPFTITDSPYGSTFFLTTGFHGFHVLVGSIWLASAMANFARTKRVGTAVKTSVLYWHFVDIVWIGVYGIIYAAGL